MSKYNKFFLFLIITAVSVSLGTYFNFAKKQAFEEALVRKQEGQLNSLSQDSPQEKELTRGNLSDKTGDASENPFSLAVFKNKKFDGRDLLLERVLEKNDEYTRYYVTYRSGELKISGIMNVPSGKGTFPVLILNHGYIDPAIYTNGRGLKREQDYLAKQGYVVFHPDYRNHAQSDKDPANEVSMRLGYVEDVINAVYAIKNSDFEFVDKERIGMLGHSMGGGIALNVMVTKPGLVKAYGLFAPVSADNKENYEKWTKDRPEVRNMVDKLLPSAEASEQFWQEISPIGYIDEITEPIMVHHGKADKTVSYAWSEDLVSDLKAQQKQVVLYGYEKEDHEFSAAWQEVMQKTVEFMDSELKSKK